MDEPREIDWSTAVVADARLSVELTGEPSREWGDHMQGVLVRLDARWAERIKVAKRRIRATGVDGDEAEELRHLLEGAVQQTNADLVAPPAVDREQPADDADGALTDAFRAFAAGDGGADAAGA
jgi:hypothetical protein